MANIKTTQAQWDKAKAYYESGLKLKEISEKTKITISSLSKKASAENWSKENEKKTLIIEDTRVRVAKENFTQIERQVHEELVDERTKYTFFFNDITSRNLKKMMEQVDGEDAAPVSIMEHRIAQAAIKDGKEVVLGKAPETAIQVNNNGSSSVMAELIAETTGKVLRPS